MASRRFPQNATTASRLSSSEVFSHFGNSSQENYLLTNLRKRRTSRLPAREVLIPFGNLSQEDFLLTQLRPRAGLTVIHSFRGSRKSITAQRIYRRSRFPPLLGRHTIPFLFLDIRYVTSTMQLDAELGTSLGGDESNRNLPADIFSSLLSLFFTSIAVGVVAAVMTFVKKSGKQKDDRGSVTSGEEWSIEWITQHLPGFSEVIVTVFLAVSFKLLRRRVIIVDDLLKFQLRNKKLSVFYVLEQLKQLSLNINIVVLSSNEGISQLFSDKNPTTFHEEIFPTAKPEEFIGALSRCLPDPPSTCAFRESFNRFGALEHHFMSVRWWQLLSEDGYGFRPAEPMSRKTMRRIALLLDLQCEEVARSYALAYSQPADVAALSGYFTPTEIEQVAQRYGSKGPRRLLLTAALLVTRDELKIEAAMLEAARNAGLKEALNKARKAAELAAFEPSAENKKRAQEAKEYHNELQRNYANASACSVSQEDREELKFVNAVREILTNAVEPQDKTQVFAADQDCREEISRIQWLF
jgi:hypothetical protein